MCPRCKKEPADFFKGHPEACRECVCAANRISAKRTYDRKRNNAKVARHVARHRVEINEARRVRHVEQPALSMLREAKRRARRKNIPFDLRLFDIHIPTTCPVLGIPIFVSGGVVTQNSPSIDRIVPCLGYVRGNVRVISFRANSLKQDATCEELQLVLADLLTLKKEVAA